MAAFRRIEEIEAWQEARTLNEELWVDISGKTFGKDFALSDQINRSCGSVMDNIAEGFDSGSDAEFARFLRYSQRSCSEMRSQLIRDLIADTCRLNDSRNSTTGSNSSTVK